VRVLLFSVLALAVLASSAWAATTEPFSSGRTAACLSAHQVLANAAATKSVVPPTIPAVSAIQFSFALVPAQAIDHGSIVFERDPATAKRASEAWYTYSVAQAQRVQGISMKQATAVIRASFTLLGNAIVLWDNQHPKAASKKRISTCLR
jgi:hypothetical protein